MVGVVLRSEVIAPCHPIADGGVIRKFHRVAAVNGFQKGFQFFMRLGNGNFSANLDYHLGGENSAEE